MKFYYRATDARGDSQRGQISAENQEGARELIAGRGWSLVELREAAGTSAVATASAADEQSVGRGQANPGNPVEPRLKRWQAGAGSVCLMLLLGWMLWPRSATPQPDTADAVATKTVPMKMVTITGVLPSEPVTAVHLSCLGAVVQLNQEAAKLGKPGEAFSWQVEVPAETGEMVVEMSRGVHRWRVASAPNGQQSVNVQPTTLPQQVAANSKPYKSHFSSAKEYKGPSVQEQQKLLEGRLQRENRLLKRPVPPVRAK